MSVFVVGLTGKRLMPTTERKARKLLKSGKATVYQRRPFTIKLNYKTGGAVQKTFFGTDTGGQHIGLSLVRTDDESAVVLHKSEIILRSSMEKRSLIEKRKEYRRGRRYRNTGYRHPKWKEHTIREWSRIPDKKGRHWHKKKVSHTSNRKEGWLPDSLDSKVDQHIDWISRYMDVLPEGCRVEIEIARFDMARIKDPDIHGEMYQHGPQYDYENVKAYVFARDNYTCRVCRKKGKKLHAHHILFKSRGATDNPEYMATVCTECHTAKAHQPGGILYKWMEEKKAFTRGMRDMTFMNILAKRIRKAFPAAWFTYGNFTNYDRRKLGLPKSHMNDASAIACAGLKITDIEDPCDPVVYRQVRCKKRSLHEANPRKGRKQPNRDAVRNRKNTKSVLIPSPKGKGYPPVLYRIWDKVEVDGNTAWIKSFTGTSAYLVDKEGKYLWYKKGKYKQYPLSKIALLRRNNGWIQYIQDI